MQMMTHPNLDLIDAFFAAYGQRDREALGRVLADSATWTFPGHHPLSGTKVGIDEVVALFDAIGSVMGSSNANVEKLVLGVNEQYVAECQHIRTNRAEGPNLDQQLCVLWSFENGKIVSGRHLTADQDALDAFFTTLLPGD
jgi:ketosteroid isomerase-like protein